MIKSYPQLFNNYIEFCDYKKNYEEKGIIDLSNMKFVYPTTLLPLLDLIKDMSCNVIYPNDPDVKNYILTIINKDLQSSIGKSYIPLIELPTDYNQADEVLEHIYRFLDYNIFGSEDTLYYLIEELVSNIYQHSCFTRAMLMAQSYKEYTDLSIFDNGITIAGCFRKHGYSYNEEEEHLAIQDALNGLSVKDERTRGFGLRTSVNIVLNGLEGSMLIVSGNGALYLDKENELHFILKSRFRKAHYFNIT